MNSKRISILLTHLGLWILPLLQVAHTAPPPPVECLSTSGYGCTVSSTYGVWPDRSTCKVAKVLYPTTEQELVAAVADGVKNHTKIKVVSKYSHSIPKLVCPGGDEGMLISTRDYARTIAVNTSSLTATVDSGVELRELVDGIAAHGMALPHSPYWDGVSVGGLLSTGAHGSSLWGRGSAVHEYVIGMRLVIPASPEEGFAKIIELVEGDEDLNAAKVSFGVLGVISQVTLTLQPLFKRSVTNNFTSDDGLEDNIAPFGLQNEFGDVLWYPSMGKAIYRVDNRAVNTTRGDGVNDFIGFRQTSSVFAELRRSAEAQVALFVELGAGLKNNDFVFTGYPVIGYQNLIQTAGNCQNAPDENPPELVCAWDPRVKGLFFHQTAVSISISQISSFISDVKKLRDADPSSLCGVDLYSGFFMRYVKKSTAYLGKTEDVVDIDITYYRSDKATTPRLNEDVLEEIEQMALFKYKGLPHWGKNRNLGFENVTSKYPDLPKFLDVRRRFDPQALFSSEWSDAVLGIVPEGVSILKDNCALEGLCICSEDRHCAPDSGYFCKPGHVFRDARVCRYNASLSEPLTGDRRCGSDLQSQM
ncbi:hypothetical protein O6H91_01G138400 [Diphasiastrum complanatum]|uniref:Uncharacterized protein n=1 Tax=Diphasiastrum complanatum TaxID=34168 RepID=A0ACC2EWL2_DIPCM|nr:hypothetical protein O6H91_01G138400 [Diphasiastrum complanatum]